MDVANSSAKSAVRFPSEYELDRFYQKHLPEAIEESKRFVHALRSALIQAGARQDDVVTDKSEIEGVTGRPDSGVAVYVPSRKIAIGYFDEWLVSTRYNPIKMPLITLKNEMSESGIQLLSVFGVEWAKRRTQVMNMLASKCCVPKRRIAARKCQVMAIPFATCQAFIEHHHIQPIVATQIYCFGLTFKDELVAVMAFNRAPFVHGSTISLTRFCCLDNCQVMGGTSKLMMYAVKSIQPYGIMSVSDNRWSSGKLYARLGYTVHHENGPAAFYVNSRGEYSTNLKATHSAIVIARPKSMSVLDRMLELGFVHYYDAGKITWIWNTAGSVPIEPRSSGTVESFLA